jgi:hypothetical protein
MASLHSFSSRSLIYCSFFPYPAASISSSEHILQLQVAFALDQQFNSSITSLRKSWASGLLGAGLVLAAANVVGIVRHLDRRYSAAHAHQSLGREAFQDPPPLVTRTVSASELGV